MGKEPIASEAKMPALLGGPPVRKTFLPFGDPCLGEEEIAEVVKYSALMLDRNRLQGGAFRSGVP